MLFIQNREQSYGLCERGRGWEDLGECIETCKISCMKKNKIKLFIQKTKIMASSPITSWQINGETVTDFILGGSKMTADGDCSHEIKRHLLFGRKVMTMLDSILKNKDITLPTKVHIVKPMVFTVVLYGCES